MAWRDSYGTSNLIVDEIRKDTESLTWVLGFSSVKWTRTITTKRERYVGMDYDTAIACQTAKHNPSGTPPVYATLKKENAAGAYMVELATVTTSSWSLS